MSLVLVTAFGLGACGASEDADATVEGLRGVYGEEPDRLDGLPGSYARAAWLVQPGELVTLTLRDDDPRPDSSIGRYLRTTRSCALPGCGAEQGDYYAIPTNPAIGWALISLRPGGERPDTNYIIDRLWRASAGDSITALRLKKLTDDGIGLPFMLYRSGP